MALNRAQLLMGDSSKGVVIPGEAQGITDGVGLSIAAGGAISVDFATLIQAQAGASNIVASTPQTSVPKDASGMTGSAYIPAGTTAERPAAAAYTGQFRYNTQIPRLEFSDGSSWIGVATGTGVVAATLGEAQAGTLTTVFSSPQTAVPKDASGMTGSAYIPAGTTAQRPTASNYTGQFRYNTTIPQLEYSDGAAWQAVGAALLPASLAEAQAGTITTKYSSPQTAVPKDASGMTGSAYLPAGTTLQRPTASNYTGQFRYNTQIPQLEYSDGTTWLGLGGLAAATLAQAQAGTLATVAATPQTAVPKDASGMTGSAYIPAGTTAQRPAATAYTGQFRYNTTIPQLEYSDGATWVAVVPPGGGVTTFSGGTTGLTPAGATSGAVTLGGTLAVANGGTGGTTQATALTNLLPSQAGNAGKFLSTDGTTPGWVAAGGAGTVTSIDVSGGTTGLTTSGGPITASGTITLAGTLALANGGTGGTTQSTAINNLLPAQSGNAGKSLGTDGTNVSWVSGGNSIKAWVYFDGNTGTVTAQDNVSSVAYIATGTYTINFTTSLTSSTYAVAGITDYLDAVGNSLILRVISGTRAASSFTLGIGGYADFGGGIVATAFSPAAVSVMVAN